MNQLLIHEAALQSRVRAHGQAILARMADKVGRRALLTASIGVATLVLTRCGPEATTTGNLMPPPLAPGNLVAPPPEEPPPPDPTPPPPGNLMPPPPPDGPTTS